MGLQLEALRMFQEAYPNSHVGGSYGLLLRGYDLKRSLNLSDLDIVVDEFDISKNKLEEMEESSNFSDFDYGLKINFGNLYVRIDLRIDKKPLFEVVEYGGVKYNVSLFEDIIEWKTKYADEGSVKHKNDLVILGLRELKEPIASSEESYDLPF